MNITVIANNDNVSINREYVNGFAFKIAAIWVECALLPVICALFAFLQDNCAHFCRIECLSPINSCPA